MDPKLKYAEPEKLLIIGLDVIDEESPLMDERATWPVDNALVQNIMVYGILQPVQVRREAGSIYVVDGRQRVKAAREAAKAQREDGGQFKIPYIEVLSDDSHVGGIMISTNEMRRDDGILTKARKAARLLSFQPDIEVVALSFGRGVKTIESWLLLVEADPAVHLAIEDGTLSASAGIELASLPREEQVATLTALQNESPAETTVSSSTKKKDPQSSRASSGVKKTWLRKAMKGDAFGRLTRDQQQVLEWIMTGQAPKGSWMDDFVWDAGKK